MGNGVIKSPEGVEALANRLRLLSKFPVTVSWSQGAPRTDRQNRLAQRWFTDIARQLGDQTHEEVRAMCKLTFAAPILLRDNAEFRACYEQMLEPLPYAARVEAVRVFDIPVTRKMKVDQMTEFMDEMELHWRSHGIRLTDPEALKYEEEFA